MGQAGRTRHCKVEQLLDGCVVGGATVGEAGNKHAAVPQDGVLRGRGIGAQAKHTGVSGSKEGGNCSGCNCAAFQYSTCHTVAVQHGAMPACCDGSGTRAVASTVRASAGVPSSVSCLLRIHLLPVHAHPSGTSAHQLAGHLFNHGLCRLLPSILHQRQAHCHATDDLLVLHRVAGRCKQHGARQSQHWGCNAGGRSAALEAGARAGRHAASATPQQAGWLQASSAGGQARASSLSLACVSCAYASSSAAFSVPLPAQSRPRLSPAASPATAGGGQMTTWAGC